MKVFLDSNIAMYAAGREHPNRMPSIRVLGQAHRGEISAATSVEVLQEILYRYSGMSRVDVALQVYEAFVEVCPVVLAVTLADCDESCRLLAEVEGISARDALHAAVMRNHGVETIASFDTGFDKVPGIARRTVFPAGV